MEALVNKAEAWAQEWQMLSAPRKAAYCQTLVDRYGLKALVVERCFADCVPVKGDKANVG